jgi:hypothetical protein
VSEPGLRDGGMTGMMQVSEPGLSDGGMAGMICFT